METLSLGFLFRHLFIQSTKTLSASIFQVDRNLPQDFRPDIGIGYHLGVIHKLRHTLREGGGRRSVTLCDITFQK